MRDSANSVNAFCFGHDTENGTFWEFRNTTTCIRRERPQGVLSGPAKFAFTQVGETKHILAI